MKNILIKIKQTCGLALFIAAFLLYGVANAQAPCRCNSTNFNFLTVSGGGVAPIKVNCNYPDISIFDRKCNTTYTIGNADFHGCDSSIACQARLEYILISPSNVAFPSQPVSTPFTLTENGTYTVQVNGWCGDMLCKTCKLRIRVSDCPPTDSCCPGNWGVRKITPAGVAGGGSQEFDCGDSVNAKCKTPYQIVASYNCPEKCGTGNVTYSVSPSGATITAAGLFTATANGYYAVTTNGWCGGKICNTCVSYIRVNDCPEGTNCCPGVWRSLNYTRPPGGNAVKFICGDTIKTECKMPIDINAVYGKCPRGCDSNVTYSVSSGTATITAAGVFTATANGTYRVEITGLCGGKACTTCVLYITVVGCTEPDCCKGTKFTSFTLSGGGTTMEITCNQKNIPVLKCNTKYIISNPDFSGCSGLKICRPTVEYTLTTPSVSYPSQSILNAFTPTENGSYILRVNGMCGNTICQQCILRFIVECDSPTNCCPGKWRTLNYTRPPGTNAVKFKCGDTLKTECKKPIDINAVYGECPRGCDSNVTYSVSPGTASINAAGVFTATANGTYRVEINGLCGGQVCTTCVLYITVTGCPESCCPGKWGDRFYGEAGGRNNPFDCGKTVEAKCKTEYQVTSSYLCPRPCEENGNVSYSVSPAGATISNTGLFTATANGTYTVTMTGMCNGKICDTCILRIKVTDCPPTNCCPGEWGTVSYNPGNSPQDNATRINCGSPQKPFKIECKKDYFINASYICPRPCRGSVAYSVSPAGATITGQVFRATQNGTYTVTLEGSCDGKVCDKCTFRFIVTGCDSSKNCCNIDGLSVGAMSNVNQHDYGTYYGSSFNLPINTGTANIQEIRASVVSFEVMYDDPECAKCYNAYNAMGTLKLTGSQPAIPPLTIQNLAHYNLGTDLGGGVKGVREIIWGGGPAVVGNVNPQFEIFYPKPRLPKCCKVTIKACIKFVFKDANCNMCEVYECFDNSGGGGDDGTACGCGKWKNKQVQLSTTATTTNIKCGDNNVPINTGSYSITFPTYECNPNTEKCKPSYSWKIESTSGLFQAGTGQVAGYNFSIPGSYYVKAMVSCAGKVCDSCSFKVNVTGPPPPGCDCIISDSLIITAQGGTFHRNASVGCGNVITQQNMTGLQTWVHPIVRCSCGDMPGTIMVTAKKDSGSPQTLTSPNYQYIFTGTGLYEFTISSSCGNKQCSCKIKVRVTP